MFRDFSAISWELLNQIFYFLAEVGGGGWGGGWGGRGAVIFQLVNVG